MKRPILEAMAFAFAAGLLFCFPATASDTAQQVVTIAWGDWLGQALTASATIVVSIIGWVVHRFAPPLIAAFITNDAIHKAVDFAIATTKDAVRGKESSIGVTNELIATAARWIIAHEPKISDWAGDNLRPLIVARLAAVGVVPAEASAVTLRLRNPAVGTSH